MKFDRIALDEYFEAWLADMEARDGMKFTRFADSATLRADEGYKEEIFWEAQRILVYDKWKQAQVGTGNILRAVISAIRFDTSSVVNNNNLVFTSRHAYTAQSLPYRALLEYAGRNGNQEVEQVLFDLYTGNGEEDACFDEIVRLNGKRFAVPAYLFFIKDKRRYLPLAPKQFEASAQALGVPLHLSHNCTWESYSQFVEFVEEIREYLADRVQGAVTLLDAHSFLWMYRGVQERKGSGAMPLPHATIRRVEIDKQRTLASKIEYSDTRSFSRSQLEARQKQNQMSGDRGEAIVVRAERERLRRANREDLAEKVVLVSDDTALGYDICSYDLDGTELHIEVKTSTRTSTDMASCYVSAHEVWRCVQDPQYRFAFVTGVNGNDPQVLHLHDSALIEEFRTLLEGAKIERDGLAVIPDSFKLQLALRAVG